jgi:hypothetical protein
MTTLFMDVENGVDASNGQTFANRFKTFASGATAARIAPGDTIRLMKSPDPTSLGVDALFADAHPIIYLAGTTRTTIADCETNWTASANVTCTLNSSDFKEGSNSQSISIASGFTTGKAAYFPTGTLDLSSKQILTFWIKQTSGTLMTATSHTIRLCSDTIGAVSVNTFTLPAISRLNQWFPVAVDLGSAAGAAIESVALYVATDQGAQIFLIDDVKITNAVTLTKTIANCDTAWTASANVTATASTARKEGTNAASLVIASGFTTGKAAYFATGTLDLSAFQKISLWVRSSSNTISPGDLEIKLCSDTTGDVPVDSFVIPTFTVINLYSPLLIDKGSALGASIQSIALYITADVGTVTLLLDNIMACQASGDTAISLTSLIGKNSAGETWWPIRSINNNTIIIDMGINSLASTTSKGYVGTSEIVTGYKREPIILTTFHSDKSIQDSGTAGSPITFSGGWDTTDMSTQTGETWLADDRNFVGIIIGSRSFITLDKISIVRSSTTAGISIGTGTNLTITNCHSNGHQTIGFSASSPLSNFHNLELITCANSSVGTNIASLSIAGICNIKSHGNGSGGIVLSNLSDFIFTIDSQNNTTSNVSIASCINNTITSLIVKHGGIGIDFNSTCANIIIFSGSSGNTTTAGLTLTSNTDIFIKNFTFSDVNEILFNGSTARGACFIQNYNTTNTSKQFFDGGTTISQSTTRHTASGLAWQMQPTSTTSRNSIRPLILKLGQFFVEANSLVTVSAWFRRSNTGLTHSLVCKGGQLAGVSADVTSSMTAAADTWEELTISFTPTEAGVVEIEAQCYGGTTHSGYVDDFEADQNGQTLVSTLDHAWLGQSFLEQQLETDGGGTPSILSHRGMVGGFIG